MQTQEQKDREAELVAIHAANLIHPKKKPALTVEERTELSTLLAVEV